MEHNYLRFIWTSPAAQIPTKGSPLTAGYDLYSSSDVILEAHGKAIIPTDLNIVVPHVTCVAPRSGLAANHFIDVGAGQQRQPLRLSTLCPVPC